ncbi:phosphoglycerate dehydrogenase-like enzyme [Arthrobacter pascens]|uniref:alpha/beta fold hydrolase n=1 Tax=Arthrobacter pascens TaxID=1677 RepID=UPI00279433F6|nr:alpha/beta fold hydrolase [Arthrobacter pascens]MDQ0678530.1 phosphoglycerate dehydrogenase-like enzyme [Arthrobacter pascens]
MLSYRLLLPEAPASAVVVAVHGLMESAECLEAAFPDWISRRWAVLAVDLRGHGGSPRWSDEDLQKRPGDVMVQDLLEVLRGPDLHRIAHLPALYYGHSAGGSVAAAVAAASLEQTAAGFRPAAVLLEDPFWRLPVTPLQDRSVAEEAYAHLIDVQSRTATERADIRRRQWPNWNEAEIQRSCRAQEDCDPRLVLNGNVIPTTPWPDLAATLAASAVPTLIITGTVRTGITPGHQRIARSAGARVEVFDGASHFIRRDMEDRFTRTAAAFFAEALAVTGQPALKPVAMAVMAPAGLLSKLMSPDAIRDLARIVDLRGPVFEDFASVEAQAALSDVEILITGWGCPKIGLDVLEAAPNLRAIIHAGGVISDKLPPIPAGRSIVGSNAGDANGRPVAEYTLAMVLLANKQAFESSHLYGRRRAEIDREQEFPEAGNYQKTVGLVGASRIGRNVAKLLQPFQLEVLFYDPYLTSADAAALGVERVSLEELMSRSDVLSVHVPVTPETTGMIGGPELALLRDGATVINTARGEIMDQTALEAELVSGRINAILDVAVPDVLPADHVFYDLPNVFLTPHIAGSMGTELLRMGDHIVAELQRYVSGQPLAYPEELS